MVPHLITALTGPISELEQRILDATPVIERWFRLEWMEHTPPIYCSADVRNAGFKLAPVATDLFPSGWHHLGDDTMPLAMQAAQAAIEKICPEARGLLIVPRNGTPGPDTQANLAHLRDIFRMAGLDVRFGSIDPAVSRPLQISEDMVFEPAQRSRYRFGLTYFDPCTILLNNPLSSGVPGILEELHEQYLLPPLQASSSVRRKSLNYQCYDEVCKRFAKLIGIDPWLLNPLWMSAGAINPHTPAGAEKLRACVDTLFAKVRRKYKEYGIQEKPFAVIKADLGNSDAHAVVVNDPLDIAAWPGPGDADTPPAEYVVQEGVLTQERLDNGAAEPVIYMIDRYVVGGHYRLHPDCNAGNALNVPGARTRPLAFAPNAESLPRPGAKSGASAPNRFYMYGVVARLALVASSYELEATDPELAED